MLTINKEDLVPIMADFGHTDEVSSFTVLQRDNYEEYDPNSREVRLILRVETGNGKSLVLRLKNEQDAPLALMDAQSRFAQRLRAKGIETPRAYRAGENYVRPYVLHGYPVIAALEDFVSGELTEVDEKTAGDTGALLARMHCIAGAEDLHVDGAVLFDPLRRNDLFGVEALTAGEAFLSALDAPLYQDILFRQKQLSSLLRTMENAPRYAVQGDLSDCNLYRTAEGRLGVFDYNRCGDNVPFFDAVMQAMFVARLMDYPEDLGPDREELILSAYLRGYDRERPFTRAQRDLFPALYALIDAFWLGDLRWNEDSLQSCVRAGDREGARAWLETIHRRVCGTREMPL